MLCTWKRGIPCTKVGRKLQNTLIKGNVQFYYVGEVLEVETLLGGGVGVKPRCIALTGVRYPRPPGGHFCAMWWSGDPSQDWLCDRIVIMTFYECPDAMLRV